MIEPIKIAEFNKLLTNLVVSFSVGVLDDVFYL